MSLRISFELNDDDLKHFRLIMREACKTAASQAPEVIVASARALMEHIRASRVPSYVSKQLLSLELMIRMLEDIEWRLPQPDAARVLNAMAYFCEPEDLIPDHIPGLGFLDDAIMIDLVGADLQHELEAYQDFCEFRKSRPAKAGVKVQSTDVTRDAWLDERRTELQERMHKRRKRLFKKK